MTFAPKQLTHHLEKGRFGRALRPEANLQGLKAGPPGMTPGTGGQISDMVTEVQPGKGPPDRTCAGPFCPLLDPMPT